MTALVVAISSAFVIAVSMCIINDYLEWRKDISVKRFSLQVVTFTFILLLVTFPFTGSLLLDGWSGQELFVGYVFLFGYLQPMFSKLMSLMSSFKKDTVREVDESE